MRKFLHRYELPITFMAALLLLAAQLGAMSHGYSHDAVAGSPPTHETGASHSPCGDCLAYAPLLAVAGASGILPFIAPQGHEAAVGQRGVSVADLSPTLAFRSRAPPELT